MALVHSHFVRVTKWFIIILSNLWTNDTSFHQFFLFGQFFDFTKLTIFIYFVVVVVRHILNCKDMLFPKFFWIFLKKYLKICNMKVLHFAKNEMHNFSIISSKTFYKLKKVVDDTWRHQKWEGWRKKP